MSELIKDIKTYIVAQLSYSESIIFLDSLPDSPDDCISITEYSGSSGLVRDEARIQVLVRNTSYSSGKTIVNAIRSLLDSTSSEQIVNLSVSRKASFKALQRPFKLKEDERKRVIFICNFRVKSSRD